MIIFYIQMELILIRVIPKMPFSFARNYRYFIYFEGKKVNFKIYMVQKSSSIFLSTIIGSYDCFNPFIYLDIPYKLKTFTEESEEFQKIRLAYIWLIKPLL